MPTTAKTLKCFQRCCDLIQIDRSQRQSENLTARVYQPEADVAEAIAADLKDRR